MDKNEILKSIEIGGAADDENKSVKNIVADSSHRQMVLSSSSGLARINRPFKLILSTPLALKALSPFEIRCCLCRKVISYPCWYHNVRYAINNFHFFVCFDASSGGKPTTKCLRRG